MPPYGQSMKHRRQFKDSTGRGRCQEQYFSVFWPLQWPQRPSETIFYQRVDSSPPQVLSVSKYSGSDRVKRLRYIFCEETSYPVTSQVDWSQSFYLTRGDVVQRGVRAHFTLVWQRAAAAQFQTCKEIIKVPCNWHTSISLMGSFSLKLWYNSSPVSSLTPFF